MNQSEFTKLLKEHLSTITDDGKESILKKCKEHSFDTNRGDISLKESFQNLNEIKLIMESALEKDKLVQIPISVQKTLITDFDDIIRCQKELISGVDYVVNIVNAIEKLYADIWLYDLRNLSSEILGYEKKMNQIKHLERETQTLNEKLSEANQRKIMFDQLMSEIEKTKGIHDSIKTLEAPARSAHDAIVGLQAPAKTAHDTIVALQVPAKTAHDTIVALQVPVKTATDTIVGLQAPAKTAHDAIVALQAPAKTAHDAIVALQTPAKTSHDSILTLQEPAKLAHNTVTSFMNSEKDGLLKLREGYENLAKDFLTNLEGMKKDSENKSIQIESLKNKIEGLLPGATSAGLAKAFFDRKEQLKRPMFLWGAVFIGSILTLTAYAYYHNSTVSDWNAYLFERLPVTLPLVVMAFFGAVQFGHNVRLMEDYAHKESLAKSFEGYKNQLETLGAGNDVLLNLCNRVIEALAKNPVRIYHQRFQAETPVAFLVDKVKDGAENIVKHTGT